MSFADEVRAQAKTKKQVAQEAAEETAKQEKEHRERFQCYLEHEFKGITETIKSRIAEAARSGNYRTEGGAKVIQDAFVIDSPLKGWRISGSVGWDNYGIEATHQVLKTKRSLLVYTPKSLDRILLKIIYPDVFQSVFREMMDGLRRDGIEAAFVVEWRIPYKCKYSAYIGTEYWWRTYQIPLEQLSEGYTIQDWFLPASSTMDRLSYADTYELSCEEKKIRCTCKFRF